MLLRHFVRYAISADGDRARIHGNDQRVSIAGLRGFLEYLWTAVIDVAGNSNRFN
jgi:hypothetical protein